MQALRLLRRAALSSHAPPLGSLVARMMCSTEANAAAAATDAAETVAPQPFQRKTKAEKRQIKYALKKEHVSKKRKQVRVRQAERWKAMDEEDRERIRAGWRAAKEDASTRLRDNMATGLRICIDLSFDESHSDRERRSCAKQLCYVHSALRHTQTPLSIHFSAYHGPAAEAMSAHNVEGWPVTTHAKNAWEVFPVADLVYLSPDAEDILPSVDPSKVYVIGGIVDRTVKKGMTMRVAEEHGIPAYRIPVKEHIRNQATHVLNIDTVVQIIARFVETNDWQVTLTELVPLRQQRTKAEKRKQRLENQSGGGGDDCDGENGGEDDERPAGQGEGRGSGSSAHSSNSVEESKSDHKMKDDR